MPWSARDASHKTRKADTPKRRRMWRDVANSAKQRGATDKSAIMQANAAVAKNKRKKKKRRA